MGSIRRTRGILRTELAATRLLGAKVTLWAAVGVLILSFLQLALTLVLHSSYVDWFLREHGYTRDTAPRGEIAGIYLALGLRTLFSALWIVSFGRLLELVAKHTSTTLWTLRAYAVICAVGYGYLLSTGGPAWMTSVRAAQCALGLVMLGCTLSPRAAAWWSHRSGDEGRAPGPTSPCS
ncbi:hypothetical protein [Flexivirga meconopsidis]|uniref:hypothetical protein n=1 Tax=Flexivirga meconopsidis TaxID=2977121 RepID=UPI002240CEEF|nr:hypothetical protein [Flexivirga meconopsidis]